MISVDNHFSTNAVIFMTKKKVIHWKLKNAHNGKNIGTLDAIFYGKANGCFYVDGFKFTPYVPKTRAKKEPELMPKHLDPVNLDDDESDDVDFEEDDDEPRLAARPMHRF